MQWLVSLWSKQMVCYSWKLYRGRFFSVRISLRLSFSSGNKLLILFVFDSLYFSWAKNSWAPKDFRLFLSIRYENFKVVFFRQHAYVCLFRCGVPWWWRYFSNDCTRFGEFILLIKSIHVVYIFTEVRSSLRLNNKNKKLSNLFQDNFHFTYTRRLEWIF